MKFQFQVDGRGFGAPIRDEWKDAVQDAVNAGYGRWSDEGAYLHHDQGAAIARINEADLNVTLIPVAQPVAHHKPVYRPGWGAVFLLIVTYSAILYLCWLAFR